MVSRTRWNDAQKYERSFWESAARRITHGQSEDLSWYSWKADNCLRVMSSGFPDTEGCMEQYSVLEIGSGPVGIVSCLVGKKRVALDPLCEFYSSKEALVRHRDCAVDYNGGRAEELAFSDGSFDMVIIDNVVDHVQEASKVMQEIHRVLRAGGRLYFTVNLHPRWGAFLHRVVAKLGIDRGHPHTFTLHLVRRFLLDHGFEVRYEEWQSYRESRLKDLAASGWKDKLKGLTGLSEYLYTAACSRRE